MLLFCNLFNEYYVWDEQVGSTKAKIKKHTAIDTIRNNDYCEYNNKSVSCYEKELTKVENNEK